jgi:hypothetical protein
MAEFTIETTYRLPVYRQRTYDANTLITACRYAVEDDDWDDAKKDYESPGDAYVSGAWEGENSAYRGPALSVPGQFDELVRRKADQFELMLGMLKILAYADDLQAPDLPAWLPRARAIIANAEAVLAGEPDPEPDPAGGTGSAYIVRELTVSRVREQVVAILETDSDLSALSAEAVTDADIGEGCIAAAAMVDLAEEIGGAEFRAALISIGKAEQRMANRAEGEANHA